MNKRLALMTILILLFLSALSISIRVKKAYAEGPIYIRVDGSIDPSAAPIFTSDNVTYFLQNNINESIVIERDNILIDGGDYKVQGSGALNTTGISIVDRTNVTIKNIRIKGFTYGINLLRSSSSTILGSNVTDNQHGIKLSSASNNRIYGSNVANTENGIIMNLGSNLNIVYQNTVTNNSYGGVRLEFGPNRNNSFILNSLEKNQYAFLFLSGSSNSYIYHNSFLDNTFPAYIDNSSSQNFWDNGYPSGGNFWSNYNGSDLNKDAIGDTPYFIGSNNKDNYPLMGAFHVFNAGQDNYVGVVSNSTLDNFSYVQSNNTIRMHVSNSTPAQTFGFCRISIPHALMNGPYNVTVDGARPPYVNYTLYDNGTDRWIYFSYQHSTREIVIVPESQTIILPPAFMMITLLAVLLRARRKGAIKENCSNHLGHAYP